VAVKLLSSGHKIELIRNAFELTLV
jgi:hypothetical protein